ncbi:MAG: tyrosine--tRNA ligase [Planctomycetaceae bacterium]|nr:tyrosine--tRNA ligase [Planctomycetaceae bacterium]
MKSDIVQELEWRGLIHQSTDRPALQAWLNEACRTLYAGFDPTADSLHVGSLMPLLYLRRFQQAGHQPIALVGGATGMIGDPSGKSQERNLLSADQLRANVQGIRQQMQRFLDFSNEDQGAVLVNNFDWMQRYSYLDFLREVGKNFPVNVMLTKDSVKARLDSDAGLSYTEFSYMLLQAFDFVHLLDEYNCQLQVGGSDQWGNITAGIDLGRRMRSKTLFGITCPLLTKSDGSKMGKTETGTIWLDAQRTSYYEFYQYWIRVADEDAGKCLRFLTELDREQIEALDLSREIAPQERASQRQLAIELTKLVHGEEGLRIAQRATDVFFGAEIDELSDAQLGQIFRDVPSAQIQRSSLDNEGTPIMDAFVAAGLAKSKGEARRTISQGGAYVNNRRVDSIDYTLSTSDLVGETTIVLRSGKKKYALLRTE